MNGRAADGKAHTRLYMDPYWGHETGKFEIHLYWNKTPLSCKVWDRWSEVSREATVNVAAKLIVAAKTLLHKLTQAMKIDAPEWTAAIAEF